ncbi:hypothetical protein BCR35DRAFT_339368 [Leucosporidium creatinivorum]|uniref:Peptidase M43 pregnancy-associated plasma-A domain-containing protein n=1 Tax=Leucosporidium creatinivorum TaxID=106004 RepID=A0A1Y2FPN5_9BASI|nr:hypothetical protein BCR35DRAFT_339368 [Leucosporidium creatinivorum]
MLNSLHLLLLSSLLSPALGAALPGANSSALYPPPSYFNGTQREDDDCSYAGLSASEVKAHEATFAALAESTGFKLQACPSGYTSVVTIPVFFHVVYWYGEPINNPNYGYVPASDLKVVVANLNKQFAAFKPRFKFVYKSTTYKKYLDYSKWTTESSIRLPLYSKGLNQIQAFARYFRGSSYTANWSKELHVYGVYVRSVNGFSFRPTSKPFLHDGVWTDENTLELSPYTPGKAYNPTTLAHEVGHWLGLQHIFQAPSGVDPCSFPTHDSTHGDLVFDTPKWKEASGTADAYYGSIECPAVGRPWSQTRSPCPGKMSATCPCLAVMYLPKLTSAFASDIQAGISNYLSYSEQECRTRFTPGQLALMLKTAVNIRKFVPSCQKLS